MPKKESTFNRSASLPTRSKKGPPPIVYDSSVNESSLSPEDRENKVHIALKEIKQLAIKAKKTYKRERKGGGHAYTLTCEELICTWIPELKKLLGIQTHEEIVEQEQALAAEENFRHYTNRDLRKWNDAYDMKRRHEDEINKLNSRYQDELQNIRKQHESALRSLREKEIQLKSLSEEKENLLTRLSQVAGAKLRDNNPAVSDLSDPNRPLKISEKVSELYDNEWTDAMEILENDCNETEAIETLLTIILKCFRLCKDYSSFQLKTMTTALVLNEKLTPDLTLAEKYAKDIQKSSSAWMLSDSSLHSIIWQEVENAVGIQNANKCKPYINKCVQYCWYMCIQDPPMTSVTFHRGTEFNSNEMKSFTKTGHFVDFTVWPALYLHENGPLLSKAVVQGTNVKGTDRPPQEKNYEKKNNRTNHQEIPSRNYRKMETQIDFRPAETSYRVTSDDRYMDQHLSRTQKGYPENRDARHKNIAKSNFRAEFVESQYSDMQPKRGEYVSYSSPQPPYQPIRGRPQQTIPFTAQSDIPASVYRNQAYPQNVTRYEQHRNQPQYRHEKQFPQATDSRNVPNEYYNETYEQAPPKTRYKSHPSSQTFYKNNKEYRSTEL